MAPKVTIELGVREFKDVADFLSNHEDDIAEDMADFGDLRGLFRFVFEDEPTAQKMC